MKKSCLILLAISLFAGPQTGFAHIGIGGREFNDGDPIDGASFSNTTQILTGSFGWADGTDANLGDSHRTRAFKFTLATTQTVTITASERDAVGQTGTYGTLFPGFSVFTTPAWVAATHDGSTPTVDDLATTYGNTTPAEPFTDTNSNGYWDVGEPFTDTNGNGFQDISLGGSGKEGAYSSLSPWQIANDSGTFMFFDTLVGHGADGTTANFGLAPGIVGDGLADGTVTMTFIDLAPGDYYIFVGGGNLAAQGTDRLDLTTYKSYGIDLTVSAVPEPATGVMVLGGIVMFILKRRRR